MLLAGKVKIKTLPAGTRGFARPENVPGQVSDNPSKYGARLPLPSGQSVIERGPQAGFTLLELLLVLFIIGLSAAVVMFSAGRLQENTLFNTEARRLYLTVKHAREISIIERRDIIFKVDGEAKRYWIDYGDDTKSEVHSMPEKFAIAGEDISFFPKGNSSGGRYELDNGKGRKYEVTVDPVLGTTAIKRL
jgi:type II secretion system protein H